MKMLVLPFLSLAFFSQVGWSQNGDRIGNGIPDIQLGQVEMRWKGERIICNVMGRLTVKSKFDQKGERVALNKRATAYNADISNGQVALDLIRGLSDGFIWREGPMDNPYIVVKARRFAKDMVLLERMSGKVVLNPNPHAVGLADFLQDNCR